MPQLNGEHPSGIAQEPTCCKECLRDNKQNSPYLTLKLTYARTFVLGHYLVLEADCLLLETDNVRGQISERILTLTTFFRSFICYSCLI